MRLHVLRPPAGLALLLLTGWAGLDAFQGMGSTVRAPRAVKPIETDRPPITVDFRDVAEQAGLTAPTISGREDRKQYILEATGNGVALFDFDNDGLVDIFLPSATTLEPDGETSNATSRLYRNRGQLRFEDVSARAGLDRVGWAQGACVGDYDNDGYRDLFVTHYGQSVLYRNQGDSTFRDITKEAGLHGDGVRWDTGCTFVDYDLDGRLDLVVTSYLEFDRARVPVPGTSGYCQWKGIPVMCGPRGLPFSRNRLFRNLGDGRFADVSDASGLGRDSSCYAFTVVATDVNDDGYPDLYIACDSTPSLLYVNRGDGTFEETGLLSGVALNADGQEQGGMGVAVADYDEDGHVDIAKTNFSDDVPNLYRNSGDGSFDDRVFQSGLGAYTHYVGWGIHFIDVDHDGLKDVLIVNGHVYPEADRLPGQQYRQPRLLYWNVGGRFKDISAHAGPAIREAWSSRGSAAGDLDNNGSLEIVISNMGSRPSLLKNVGPRGNWLLVQCVGTRVNRDAIGARVVVHAGGTRISGEVQSGASFISQNDARLHMGLGTRAHYDAIEVRWPGGVRERFAGGPANQLRVLTEGTGERVDAPAHD
jgi:enediyne biosynthesis protein E4